MASEVRAAMVQTGWTGDKESMIELHEKYLAEAAEAGAPVVPFLMSVVIGSPFVPPAGGFPARPVSPGVR